MAKLKELVSEGDVDPDLLRETVDELVPLVQESLTSDDGASSEGVPVRVPPTSPTTRTRNTNSECARSPRRASRFRTSRN